MTHMYQFDTEGQAVVFPRGPRPGPTGESDSVRMLSQRIDRLLASLPRPVAHKTAAPAPGQADDDELDGSAIFAARQQAIADARDGTTKTQAATDEIDADAIFAMRK